MAPTLEPALKIPVAKALSFFGNHSAVVLMAEGKFPDSPKPSPKRAIEKPITLKALLKKPIVACNIPKILHIPMESIYPFLVPNLSIIIPIVIIPDAYASLKKMLIQA